MREIVYVIPAQRESPRVVDVDDGGIEPYGEMGSGNVLRMRVPLMTMLKYAWIEKAETHTLLEVTHRQLDAFWDLFPNLFFVTGFRG